MYILFAILIFGFLIFIHELGHFMTAKLLGVQVNEFSICMGPALLQRTRGETTYSLRLIPIGGYCAMEGELSHTFAELERIWDKYEVYERAINEKPVGAV